MQVRKYYIDFLKFIGLLCLFFAHVDGPAWIENIRNFDVPLMVILSGMLGSMSINNVNSYEYIIKRVKRLVVPTWLFLVFFYTCMIVVGPTPTFLEVVKAFLFQRDSGIAGGVWIIWIYLICAVFTPLINKYKGSKLYWILLGFLLFINEIAIVEFPDLTENRFLYYSFFSIIPYVALLSIGLIYENLSKKKKISIILLSLLVCVMTLVYARRINGGFPNLFEYKYPARLFYDSYGVFVSLLLYEVVYFIQDVLPMSRVIEFISKHSLWIYLWQIMILTIINYVFRIRELWLICYVILVVGSLLVTWIQNLLVSIISKRVNWRFLKYFTC